LKIVARWRYVASLDRVCVYVSVCLWTRLRSHFSNNLHEILQEPLGSKKEDIVSLGSKSENVFSYFNPKTKFTTEISNSQPNIKCKIY